MNFTYDSIQQNINFVAWEFIFKSKNETVNIENVKLNKHFY